MASRNRSFIYLPFFFLHFSHFEIGFVVFELVECSEVIKKYLDRLGKVTGQIRSGLRCPEYKCKEELVGGGVHTTFKPEAQSFISVSWLVKQTSHYKCFMRREQGLFSPTSTEQAQESPQSISSVLSYRKQHALWCCLSCRGTRQIVPANCS